MYLHYLKCFQQYPLSEKTGILLKVTKRLFLLPVAITSEETLDEGRKLDSVTKCNLEKRLNLSEHFFLTDVREIFTNSGKATTPMTPHY